MKLFSGRFYSMQRNSYQIIACHGSGDKKPNKKTMSHGEFFAVD